MTGGPGSRSTLRRQLICGLGLLSSVPLRATSYESDTGSFVVPGIWPTQPFVKGTGDRARATG
jgi:hypothetical protein